jgi:hypothetical protein
VAVLVSQVSAEGIELRLVNLSPQHERRLVLQAGAFGEHQFLSVRAGLRTSDFPGRHTDYAAPDLATEPVTLPVDANAFTVELPPATQVTLAIALKRFANIPSYRLPVGMETD